MNIHSLCPLAVPEKSATVVSHPTSIRCSHRMEAKGWSDERGGRRLSPGVLMPCSPLAASRVAGSSRTTAPCDRPTAAERPGQRLARSESGEHGRVLGGDATLVSGLVGDPLGALSPKGRPTDVSVSPSRS